MRALLCTLAFVFLCAGCVTSELLSTSYDEDRDRTRYETRRINLGTMFSGSALGGGVRVNLRSWATCEGRECQPEQAWLSFAISGSSNTLQIHDRTVTLRTEEERYSWPQREVRRPTEQTTSLIGEVARIALEPDMLEDIATAQNVSGSIGSESFSLSHDQRAPLRELADRFSD